MMTINATCTMALYNENIKPYVNPLIDEKDVAGLLMCAGSAVIKECPDIAKEFKESIKLIQYMNTFEKFAKELLK